jgi:hypothetical protein
MWNLLEIARRTVHRLTTATAAWREPPVHVSATPITFGPNDDPVGRLAVLVLRAVAGDGEALHPNQVRILPDQRVLNDSEAAARLAGLQKPLQCAASASGGSLEIAWAPLGAEGRWIWEGKQELAHRNGGWLGPLEYEAVRATESRNILYVGRGESAVVPVDVAERFEQDYVLLGNYTMVGDSPERFGVAATATARWYSPSHGRTAVRPSNAG